MKKVLTHRTLFALFLLVSVYSSQAQCTISSSCGYAIDVFIKPISIVPSSNNCPNGYNYNVTFAYTITTSGVNNCYNDNFGLQPQILCNGQNNGYYTLNVAAPTVGAPATSASVSGTVTTSTNPYNSGTDCASATPQSLNCNSLKLSIYGPGISSGTYPCSFSTLPVELLSFSSSYENKRVRLNWITITEKNNSYFALERSSDGLNWTLVKNIPGAGTSAMTNSYETEDTDFTPGINYYRLKQVDVDGNYKYSDITVVSSKLSKNNLNYFPNPFINDFVIDSESDDAKTISISNGLGEPVYRGTMGKRVIIDFSSQASGVYFVTLKTSVQQEHFKIVKH